MEFRELAVAHAFEFIPALHADDRGVFLESYRADVVAQATGRRFDLAQSNISVSRRGVARGIHFAEVGPPATATRGQAKYVTTTVGTVLDVVVDLRVGSPSFGAWDAIELDETRRNAIFVPEGVGHLFIATSDTATVSYLTNDFYRPAVEHAISPIDPALGIELPFPGDELVLSSQDRSAPTLDESRALGYLPNWDDALALYASLSITGTDRTESV